MRGELTLFLPELQLHGAAPHLLAQQWYLIPRLTGLDKVAGEWDRSQFLRCQNSNHMELNHPTRDLKGKGLASCNHLCLMGLSEVAELTQIKRFSSRLKTAQHNVFFLHITIIN